MSTILLEPHLSGSSNEVLFLLEVGEGAGAQDDGVGRVAEDQDSDLIARGQVAGGTDERQALGGLVERTLDGDGLAAASGGHHLRPVIAEIGCLHGLNLWFQIGPEIFCQELQVGIGIREWGRHKKSTPSLDSLRC